jgi:signal peptidase I
MKITFKKILFLIGFILVVLFFIWSRLFLTSLLLLLILDSFTLTKVSILLKKKLSKSFYHILKYGYIVLIPLMFAIFFRVFFVDFYYVPSSSMERTLFPGDYIAVNKFHYGVKVPKHLRNFPVLGSFFESPDNNYDLYKPLKSFTKFQREDIVVFKAVDDSDKFLVKRMIGMPGDTLEIKASKVFINSKEQKEGGDISYGYNHEMENEVTLYKNYSNKEYEALSEEIKSQLKKNITIKPNYNYSLFPFSKQELWTRDNYGELRIPKKGMQVLLTKDNINIYRRTIRNFEGENIRLKNDETKLYTFKNNYYFMMGDNRHNSIDSRSFGFVPESYVQGKMISVF